MQIGMCPSRGQQHSGCCNKAEPSVKIEQTYYCLCGLLMLYTLCKPPAASAHCAITPPFRNSGSQTPELPCRAGGKYIYGLQTLMVSSDKLINALSSKSCKEKFSFHI